MDKLELNEDEMYALVNLVRYVMRADGRVTDTEMRAMMAIGRQVGLVAFSDALEKTHDTSPLSGEELLRLARMIGTHEKRVEVFRMLAELAHIDGIDALELKLLNAIAATWGLEWST